MIRFEYWVAKDSEWTGGFNTGFAFDTILSNSVPSIH